MNNLPKEQINGKWYQPVEYKPDNGDCEKCAFSGNGFACDLPETASCSNSFNKYSVYFIEVQNEE